jgi:multisubunit Na+/H+ antiporter MnhC subunit
VLDPFRLLEALLLITLLAGLLGLISRRNLFLKALAMDVMGRARSLPMHRRLGLIQSPRQ